MAEQTKKMLLLDAMALIYRAYYGLGDNFLFNSKGMNTTAISLFTDSLNRFIKKEQPTHIAIAFDTHAPTERDKLVDDYKANREEIPEDLLKSIPYIKEILKGFKIPILELDGYEADDIIGTLAKKAGSEGYKVYMITPDKDYGQLVDENVFMYKPPYRGKPEEIYGVPEILAKWDIERVDQVIDMLGLMGDKVDNIPGIPGVGEKTACKLLKQFDNMENLLENTDQLKGKLKEKVIEHAELARVSKQLATIILDVPVNYNFDDFVLEEPDKEILSALFAELEFRTMGKRILGDSYNVNLSGGKAGQRDLFNQGDADDKAAAEEEPEKPGLTLEDVEHEYICIDTEAKIKSLVKQLSKQKLICFDTETTGIDANEAELVGLSFSVEKGKAWYIPVEPDMNKAKATVAHFKSIFENEKIAKVAQNIKYDILMMRWYGIEVKGTLEDTMLAHYLLEPEMRHKMDFMAESYLNYTPQAIEELIGKKGKNQGSMRDVPVEKVTDYAAEDADITLQLFHYLKPQIKEKNLQKLYDEVEMPLVPVLAEMEYNGVLIDMEFLKRYSHEVTNDILKIREEIHNDLGDFNLDSPKQLGNALFDNGIISSKGKKTKTGQYSTNEETLLKLEEGNPVVSKILKYRTSFKLKTAYLDSLPKLINPRTGRVHTNYMQAAVVTGRISSDKPNLQNIPIRRVNGKKVREAFIPRNDDFIILSADYSQVELRIIAALSEDETMIQAFKDGIDIHKVTAAKVYKVSIDEVDDTMRRNAKTVNFGLIYGISAYGLSQRLKIKRKEAQTLIDEYFTEYPFIKKYMESMKEFAREHGYVETILGRRRKLKDINSKNATVRGFAERLK